ncbi:MAG: PEP-CTERM sorting domain-containing protein [Terrimicrobiaceae bacterium]|nr:PEP-CTERM sorting domain-containing protein [Terrimicrobiaceae bacterium]
MKRSTSIRNFRTLHFDRVCPKRRRHISLRFGASLLAAGFLFVFSSSSSAQTFPDDNNSYWAVGDGFFSDVNNYSLNGGTPEFQPSGRGIFGYPGTPSTAIVTINDSEFLTGPLSGYSVISGNFTFDLHGETLPLLKAPWVFGDGAGNTPTVSFADTVGSNSIMFDGLTLGANGSSNNIFGGPNATIAFAPNITPSFSTTGGLAIGSTAGGGNNVLNVGSGNAFTFSTILVNAGASNQLNIRDGGSLASTGKVTIGAGSSFLLEGTGSSFARSTATAAFEVFGDATVQDGASLSFIGSANAAKLIIGAGASFVASGADTNVSFVTKNSNATTTATLDLSGRLEVTNGATFDAESNLKVVTADAVIKVDADSVVRLNTETTNQASNAVVFNTGAKLTLEGGGTVYAKGTASLGTANAGEYKVVSNDGTLLKVDRLSAPGYVAVLGTLLVGTGGMNVTSTTNIGEGTHVEIASLSTLNGSSTGTLRVKTGGILSGSGLFAAQVIVEGGEIRIGPDFGEDEPGILDFRRVGNSSLSVLDGSTFSFDLFGEGINDQVITNGSMSVLDTAWNIQVSLANGFEIPWAVGQEYNLFNTGGIGDLNLTGASFTSLPDLGPDFSWDTSQFSTTGSIFVGAAVPEPDTYALLGFGVAAIACLRRLRVRQTKTR